MYFATVQSNTFRKQKEMLFLWTHVTCCFDVFYFCYLIVKFASLHTITRSYMYVYATIQAYCLSHLHLLFGCILSTLNKDVMMMMRKHKLYIVSACYKRCTPTGNYVYSVAHIVSICVYYRCVYHRVWWMNITIIMCLNISAACFCCFILLFFFLLLYLVFASWLLFSNNSSVQENINCISLVLVTREPSGNCM